MSHTGIRKRFRNVFYFSDGSKSETCSSPFTTRRSRRWAKNSFSQFLQMNSLNITEKMWINARKQKLTTAWSRVMGQPPANFGRFSISTCSNFERFQCNGAKKFNRTPYIVDAIRFIHNDLIEFCSLVGKSDIGVLVWLKNTWKKNPFAIIRWISWFSEGCIRVYHVKFSIDFTWWLVSFNIWIKYGGILCYLLQGKKTRIPTMGAAMEVYYAQTWQKWNWVICRMKLIHFHYVHASSPNNMRVICPLTPHDRRKT